MAENWKHLMDTLAFSSFLWITVKILKFGTPQTIAIIVLKIEKFDVTWHLCIQKMLMEWQTA